MDTDDGLMVDNDFGDDFDEEEYEDEDFEDGKNNKSDIFENSRSKDPSKKAADNL